MSEKMYALTGATGHVGFALLKEMLANGDKTRIILRKDPGYFEGMDVEKVKQFVPANDLAKDVAVRKAMDFVKANVATTSKK